MASDKINTALNALLRGVAHNDWHTVRHGWKSLVEANKRALPSIRQKLAGGSFETADHIIQAKYLAVLLSLLHEIDASAFRKSVVELRAGKLHPINARILSVIEARANETPLQATIKGIEVSISESIVDREAVLGRVTRWLETPDRNDLAGILRIDVIPSDPSLDYLGLHSYAFSGIVLTWPKQSTSWLLNRSGILNAETTLYHEIGHHTLGHSEGGQVPEQEEEANWFARKLMRRAHPIITFMVYTLGLPFVLARMIRRRSTKERTRVG